MKFVNSATAIRVPARRCSRSPIEVASIAQAWNPASTKRLKPACTVTGSGVVMPVKLIAIGCSGDGGSPTPRVPITPQRRPSELSACATHQAVEVLPLVPVTAITSRRSLGLPMKALASAPVAAFRPGSAATSSRSRPVKFSTPSASTRQALAPAASACAT